MVISLRLEGLSCSALQQCKDKALPMPDRSDGKSAG